jgi:ribosomal protein S18 acetylase RimI-like enzyme
MSGLESDLEIARATPTAAAEVVALLDAAAAWQQSRAIDQWKPGTFEQDVLQTIANGDLYVAHRDGAMVGCFMLDDGSPRMTRWLVSQGREPTRGVVGRLAVTRDVAGSGLGLQLLRHAERLASSDGITVLRLECPSDNERLRRYYVEAGFTYCGDDDLPGPNGEPWVSSVYERLIAADGS